VSKKSIFPKTFLIKSFLGDNLVYNSTDKSWKQIKQHIEDAESECFLVDQLEELHEESPENDWIITNIHFVLNWVVEP